VSNENVKDSIFGGDQVKEKEFEQVTVVVLETKSWDI
jgi:hypothetical protein